MPCNHEEADTRIFLHLKNIIEMFKISEIDTDKICICANDTDVVVIAIALFHQLNINELWFEFDVGKDKRWLPIHKYATTLSEEKCNGILFWYAFTGCDTMSSFYGRSKKTAWDVWKVCNDITNVFIRLSKHGQLDVKNEDVKKLERFVVLLYDRTSDVESVNECRQILFAQKGRNIELIPPTEDALYQHIKRAVLQARFIWNTSLQKQQIVPDVSNWGWCRDNAKKVIIPKWITGNEASRACQELIKCGCKQKCGGRCKCKSYNLECTDLCKCSGNCN